MPDFGFSKFLIPGVVKLILHPTEPLTPCTYTAGSFLEGPPQGQGRLWGAALSALPLVQIQQAPVLSPDSISSQNDFTALFHMCLL